MKYYVAKDEVNILETLDSAYDITEDHFKDNKIVFFEKDGNPVIFNNLDDVESFIVAEERRIWMDAPNVPRIDNINDLVAVMRSTGVKAGVKPKESSKGKSISDHVDPDHYKGYIEHLQWIEAMQYVIDDFSSAIEMQVRKYLDRCGKKDDSRQELLKALWYMKFWAAYEINGRKPIRIHNVEQILEEEV
jgi:hypothetical protein